MELMKLNVECYAGRKADERPIRFRLEGRQYLVEAVIDQWYDPERIFYKVDADDGNLHSSVTDTIDGRGIWFRFVRQDKSMSHEKLAVPGDPHLPSIERKV